MDYVDVLTKFHYPKSKNDPIPLIVKQSDGNLISLVSVCTKNNGFIFNQIKIDDYFNKYLKGTQCRLWIDSGGYNLFRKWNLDESSLSKYIDAYNHFMVSSATYARIFSLDFPIAVPHRKVDNTWFNTREMVKKWNMISQERALATLNKNPEIKEKYTFVYQFRTLRLYEIWSEIYKELDLGKHIVNRAIGGLVGAYSASKKVNRRNGKRRELLFSPVIGPAFVALNDYIKAGNFNNDFNLHFLGISTAHDEFVIIFLERLFCRYLAENGLKVRARFSVDTRHHSQEMDKYLRKRGIYHFFPEGHPYRIRKDDKIRYVADDKLVKVFQDEYKIYIKEEIEKTYNIGKMDINTEKSSDSNTNRNTSPPEEKERVTCTADFYPLSIYSNNNLIRFFDVFIGEQNLVDHLFAAKNRNEIENAIVKLFEKIIPAQVKKSLVEISEPVDVGNGDKCKIDIAINTNQEEFAHEKDLNDMSSFYDFFIFPKSRNKIKTSLSRIYQFHKWFVKDGRDPVKLDKLIVQFIKDIGIKDRLK